jgi:tyrosyl-tRNA synthetase
MTSLRSALMNTLHARGFINQTTPLDALDSALSSGPMTIYYGCDATAPSLHVGNLIGLMVMRWAQELGHRALVLIGGGTTKVGDPSGRDTTRKLLSNVEISDNIRGILSCYARVLKPDSMTVVNNADWLDTLGYTSFLRDIGVHFSVNRLLNFDSVKTRLDREESLSFIEFNYILMQSYDYLQLYRNNGCVLQVGGADQWGNIVSGVDLIRRTEGVHVHGLTWPLLQTSSGAKMGKTAHGAVWLDPDRLSPYDYWQFWRNVDDGDVVRFLKLFTLLPLTDIEPFSRAHGQELNAAKILLADQATALIHGLVALKSIHRTVTGDQKPGQEGDLQTCPTYTWTADDRANGVLVYKMILALGWVSSGREGRQKIIEGAVKIGGKKIQDPMHRLFYDAQSSVLSQTIHCGVKKSGTMFFR